MFGLAADFQTYLQQYVDATHPAALCNNQYDFLVSGDMHYLTENVATLGAVARANGLPFWGIVQLPWSTGGTATSPKACCAGRPRSGSPGVRTASASSPTGRRPHRPHLADLR